MAGTIKLPPEKLMNDDPFLNEVATRVGQLVVYFLISGAGMFGVWALISILADINGHPVVWAKYWLNWAFGLGL